MARALLGLVVAVIVVVNAVRSAPVLPDNPPDEQQIQHFTQEQKAELVKQLEADIVRAYALRAVAEGVRLENAAEDRLVEAAVEALEENPGPERRAHLEQVQELLKRDRRAVEALTGLLAGSGGAALPPPAAAAPPPPPPPAAPGVAVGASAGSDSGSILNLIGPLLGGSSGGNAAVKFTSVDEKHFSGKKQGAGAAGGANGGSGSGSILSLVGPLLGSSSGSGGSDGDEDDENDAGGGGSDSGSILNLVGPLLGSSSAGGGGDEDGEGGGSDLSSIINLVLPLLGSSSGGGGGAGTANANGGSDSGAILNLIGPLLGSSAGGGGASAGGSGLGTILTLLTSSKQASLSGTGGGVLSSLAGLNIKGQIKGAKIALVGDKIQLLLRLKFGLLTKMINTISGILQAKFPADPIGFDNLRYPD